MENKLKIKMDLQKEIDKIIVSLITGSFYDLDKSTEQYAAYVCEGLYSVYNKDCCFEPSYLKVLETLHNKQELSSGSGQSLSCDRASSAKRLIENIISYLNKNHKSFASSAACTAMRIFGVDDNFQYYVNTFLRYTLREIRYFEMSVLVDRSIQIADDVVGIGASMTDIQKEVNALANDSMELNKNTRWLKDDVQKVLQDAKILENNTKIAHEKVKKAIDDSKSILPNLLTAMGIFVAIIIAIVVLYLSTVIGNTVVSGTIRYSDSICSRLLVIFALATVAFNLVFAFIFWISKLSGSSIASACYGCAEDGKCHMCKKEDNVKKDENGHPIYPCGSLKRVFKRYWYYFAFNIIMAIFIVGCVLMGCFRQQPSPPAINDPDTHYNVNIDVNGKYDFRQKAAPSQDEPSSVGTDNMPAQNAQ